MANLIKFGSTEVFKFIEIYRSHECLWDTSNQNYKNRDMRNAALSSFAEELGIDGFGPKEITTKIKNIRSQYLQEKKKIRASTGTGSSTEDVYHPKLQWFNLLDSFLVASAEPRTTCSNLVS
uniref:MADF domain-containing protein n=1 Tax=Sipha flava TaxID=143950 RepID=A0A2S2QQS5_9HEMI